MIKKSLSRIKNKLKKNEVKSDAVPYRMYVDSPDKNAIASKGVTVSGWLLPLGETAVVHAMRIKNNDQYIDLPYGESRPDLAAGLPEYSPEKTANIGFRNDFQFTDGPLEIEVDFGEGFASVYQTTIHYSSEMLFEMLYNPNLATYWAEHQNLLANRARYFHEGAHKAQYVRHKNDPKLIAFYLPQFHPIKENNEVWGQGFTEWTNVTSAVPRFVGHQQPILPADLGFYDLRLDEKIYEQIELAKRHGIYGFCVYYYWFSGEKLLEKPLETLLKHPEWDFNFTICWANENWTKRWDGRDDDIIIAQKYSPDDPLKFIKDVEGILLDPRYIRVDDKPVLIVYRASDLKEPERYTKIWREYFKSHHGQDLHLVSMMGFDVNDPRKYGFDAGLEFAPLTTVVNKEDLPGGELPLVDIKGKLLDVNFEGGIVDYRKLALNKNSRKPFKFPTYRSVMPSWDNEARKKGKGASFYMTSPDVYAEWLDAMLDTETTRTQAPFLFINAWNEWAEGTVLEPTAHYGHAIINRTSEVLSKYSHNKGNQESFPLYGLRRNPGTALAVVVHAFYETEWGYIDTKLAALAGTPYDLFVTINQKDKHLGDKIQKKYKNAHITVVPNRGRDMLPFLFLAKRLEKAGYEYVLKLHTKKSLHLKDGSDWFTELVDTLLPAKGPDKIIKSLRSGTALIGPDGHYLSLKAYLGSNAPEMERLLSEMYDAKTSKSILGDDTALGYFAGSMYWLRLDAMKQLLDLYLMPEDFEAEKGQIDGTFAHALERLITLLPVLDKKKLQVSNGKELFDLADAVPADTYKYAPIKD